MVDCLHYYTFNRRLGTPPATYRSVNVDCGPNSTLITERFSEVNCFRRIGESDREAHALNRIFWPICRFFVRKLQVGDKVKWQ